MNQVKISPKFQVVIPKDVRELLGLKAGQHLHVVPYRGRIELVPVQDIKENARFSARDGDPFRAGTGPRDLRAPGVPSAFAAWLRTSQTPRRARPSQLGRGPRNEVPAGRAAR